MRMREKIARALCRRNHAAISPNSEELRNYVEQNWNKWTYEADAVLDALMTPDEGMVAAANERCHETAGDVGMIWQAMLAAARSEQGR